MPDMWGYFTKALDRGAPYAVQGEQLRVADEQNRIAEMNARTKQDEQALAQRMYSDQLVDFGDMAGSGYKGPMKDVIEMFDAGRGGQVSPASLLNPWIQPEYYSAMQSRGERLQRDMMSAQAKALADQLQALMQFSQISSQLSPPKEVPTAGPYQQEKQGFLPDLVRLYRNNQGTVPFIPMLGLGLKAWHDVGSAAYNMITGEDYLAPEIVAGGTTMIDPNVVPDENGISLADKAAMASLNVYNPMIGLLRSGYMPAQENLNAGYTAGEYATTDPLGPMIGRGNMASGLLNGIGMMMNAMTPEQIQKAKALQAAEALRLTREMEVTKERGAQTRETNASKKK